MNKYGLESLRQVDKLGHSALTLAVKNGRAKCVEILLKHKANPNHEDQLKATPLHYVRDMECCILLLDSGADINKANMVSLHKLM